MKQTNRNAKKKLTLTVGLPVYNEEVNIANILSMILRQKQKSHVLEKIMVFSDASSDATHKIVRSFMEKHPEISLVIGRKRKGKYLLMGRMFRKCTSDVLIVLDADIALAGAEFNDTLVRFIQNDSGAMMVSAHQIFIEPKGFIAKVIYAHFLLWDYIRLSIPGYANAINFYASATAFRGSFARRIHVSSKLADPHLYLYMVAAQAKGYRYCRDAVILQWPITTLHDLHLFLRRSLGKRDFLLEKMFGIEVRDVYHIPFRYKLYGALKAFAKRPFYIPLGFLLSYYMNKKAQKLKADSTAVWEIVKSTKKPFGNSLKSKV